jgi:predicted TIM-barrel fold metal-dependent hydrolase
METPWVDRHPLEIAKDHVRLTIQPYDAPPRPDDLEKLIEHFDSDEMLLFSSDYPHWHYEGNNAIPDGISKALQNKICYDNPLATYPRLKEAVT